MHSDHTPSARTPDTLSRKLSILWQIIWNIFLHPYSMHNVLICIMCFKQLRNKIDKILSMYDISWLRDDAWFYVMYVALYNLCHYVGQYYSAEKYFVYEFTDTHILIMCTSWIIPWAIFYHDYSGYVCKFYFTNIICVLAGGVQSALTLYSILIIINIYRTSCCDYNLVSNYYQDQSSRSIWIS